MTKGCFWFVLSGFHVVVVCFFFLSGKVARMFKMLVFPILGLLWGDLFLFIWVWKVWVFLCFLFLFCFFLCWFCFCFVCFVFVLLLDVVVFVIVCFSCFYLFVVSFVSFFGAFKGQVR